MLRDRTQQFFALNVSNARSRSDTVSEKSWQEINISGSALQSSCKVLEGLGKAPQKTVCSQHLKQQEVPELLSRKFVSLQGNFKAHFADMCDPEIAFPRSLTLAKLCHTQPGWEQAGEHREPGSDLLKAPRAPWLCAAPPAVGLCEPWQDSAKAQETRHPPSQRRPGSRQAGCPCGRSRRSHQ